MLERHHQDGCAGFAQKRLGGFGGGDAQPAFLLLFGQRVGQPAQPLAQRIALGHYRLIRQHARILSNAD